MISVDTAGAWRLYSPVLPAGAEPLGTVRRGVGDVGALVRFAATGIYAQVNAGAVRSLDQRQVERLLAEMEDTP